MATWGGQRSGSDSRCCDESLAPLEWRDYVDADHSAVRELDEWLGSLAPFARLHEEGEIDALMERARGGLLADSGDARTPIKPIWENPEVFELRRRSLSKNLRFYHGEPREEPQVLVALHRHIKSGAKSQQEEIEYAAKRYQTGRSHRWG